MSGSDSLFNSAAAFGIGGYLLAVVYQGNVKELGNLLKEETGYVDFVIALFVLGAIQKYGPTSKISSALTILALFAFAIKTANNNPNFRTSFNEFGNGNASILETIKKIAGVS